MREGGVGKLEVIGFDKGGIRGGGGNAAIMAPGSCRLFELKVNAEWLGGRHPRAGGAGLVECLVVDSWLLVDLGGEFGFGGGGDWAIKNLDLLCSHPPEGRGKGKQIEGA